MDAGDNFAASPPHSWLLPVSLSYRKNRALIFDTAEMAGGINGHEGMEEAMSPRQMRLVGDEFGAPEVPYTEEVQYLIPFYGCVINLLALVDGRDSNLIL